MAFLTKVKFLNSKIMKKIFVLFFSLSLLNNALADCEADSIKSKTEDGSVIILNSGEAWEINPVDRTTTYLWLPLEDVIVCDDNSIIHKDDAEKVEATKIN